MPRRASPGVPAVHRGASSPSLLALVSMTRLLGAVSLRVENAEQLSNPGAFAGALRERALDPGHRPLLTKWRCNIGAFCLFLEFDLRWVLKRIMLVLLPADNDCRLSSF